MELNYKAIMDYYRCPMLYYFKHELKLHREDPEKELYESCLNKAIMFYYYSIMNGRYPTIEQLRNKWYKMWDKGSVNRTVEEVIFTDKPSKGTNSNKKVEGLKTLEAFYNYEIEQEFVPLVVDTDVRVQIGRHYVSGTLELIREIKGEKNNFIELVKFKDALYPIDRFRAQHDFQATFESYAFRTLFEMIEDRVLIVNPRRADRIPVKINEQEYARLIAIVNDVGDCIEEKRIHPIVTWQCKHCFYQDVCDKYKL